MRGCRFLLAGVVVLGLLALGSCVRTVERVGSLPEGSAVSDETGAEAPTPPAPRFSAPAFLDRSLFVLGRELFSTRSGKMLRGALFFPAPTRVLLFISSFDLAVPERQPGNLYLVLVDDPSTTYALKDRNEILMLHRSPDELVVYYEAVRKLEASSPEQSGKDAGQRAQPDEPPADTETYEIALHRLTAAGKDEALKLNNVRVAQVLPEGKLLLARVTDTTAFAGTYFTSLSGAYKLYDTRGQEDVFRFDYRPLLSSSLAHALRVVVNYDPSDYEDCFFALYAGKPSDSRDQLALVSGGPLYLTFTEERWRPVVQFVGEDRLLLSRFVEDAGSAEQSGYLPHTAGKISLGLFDLDTQEFVPVIPEASPYLRVFWLPDELVFFYTYYDLLESGRRHHVVVSTLDGMTTRELLACSGPKQVSIADVDLATGSVLLVESYVSANEDFSLLRELKLSEEPPPPATGESVEGSLNENPLPQEPSSPPLLRLPLGRA